MKIEIKKPEQVFEILGLQENSVYKVRVKTASANVEHESLLVTGFKNGNYCKIYNNTYGGDIPMMQVYSMKIIKRLCSLK